MAKRFFSVRPAPLEKETAVRANSILRRLAPIREGKCERTGCERDAAMRRCRAFADTGIATARTIASDSGSNRNHVIRRLKSNGIDGE